jgi:F-type H+-transporting ATPase subunit epsilon
VGIFLEISTPEGFILEKQTNSVTVPTVLGPMGILPGHVPLATLLVPGLVQFVADGRRESIAVDSGFLLLQSNVLSLTVDAAVDVVNIDAAEAENARKRAEEALEKAKQSAQDANEIAQLEAKIRFQIVKQRARRP